MATAAYVERLLTGRDHIEQGVRSCLGILRLATRYPGEQLEAACVRAMSAGASSSGFVEHLLKSGRRLVDPVLAEDASTITATFVVPATTTADPATRTQNAPADH